MLWNQYVFRRGSEALDMWDHIFQSRRNGGKPLGLLYIAGYGFDIRAQSVMSSFVDSITSSGCDIKSAKLMLVGFKSYQLSDELKELTKSNTDTLKETFKILGDASTVIMDSSAEGEDDISSSNALKIGTESVLQHVSGQTDIVLDVSSLPRIAYLSLLLALLQKLVAEGTPEYPLSAGGINLHILVGEDAKLDGNIKSEDPSNDLVLIPGYSTALQAESMQDWPMVWFPILGENRTNQLQKVSQLIPATAEICPVLPHPSREPRRGDRLLIEYKEPLFDARETPLTNVLYAHESHPFETYRQLLGAMKRYQKSMSVVGGCRLVVTPLASKLITLGAALACFEMKHLSKNSNYSVAIPYAEPQRYSASKSDIEESKPDISALILTGESYE